MWQYAHGIDLRPVKPLRENLTRRSVGCEINWGIRFEREEDATEGLGRIATEVAKRMKECQVSGRTITVKVKRRKVSSLSLFSSLFSLPL